MFQCILLVDAVSWARISLARGGECAASQYLILAMEERRARRNNELDRWTPLLLDRLLNGESRSLPNLESQYETVASYS